jgi:hypothetical protein
MLTLELYYYRSQIPEITDLASLAHQIEMELKKQNKILGRLQSEVFNCNPQIDI